MSDTHTTAPVWEGERAPLIKALVAAQKSSEAVLKAASNPAFRSRYADLAAVVEAVVPALNRAGVAVIQSPAFDGEMMTLTTILAHEGGSTLTASLSMRPTKADPQGVGSAVTYARRYALLAMTGAAPEDDDGNAASAPKGRTVNPMSANQAKQDGRGEAYNVRSHEIRDLTEVSECLAWGASHKPEFDAWPKGWRDNIREELATHMAGLRDAAAAAFRLSGDDSLAGDDLHLADDER